MPQIREDAGAQFLKTILLGIPLTPHTWEGITGNTSNLSQNTAAPPVQVFYLN
jgi:hypothetical protein